MQGSFIFLFTCCNWYPCNSVLDALLPLLRLCKCCNACVYKLILCIVFLLLALCAECTGILDREVFCSWFIVRWRPKSPFLGLGRTAPRMYRGERLCSNRYIKYYEPIFSVCIVPEDTFEKNKYFNHFFMFWFLWFDYCRGLQELGSIKTYRRYIDGLIEIFKFFGRTKI